MLDPDLLRTFAAIADCGGFTAAGDVVGRSQSAVSMQMRRLEEVVGKPLLRRNSKAVSLTPDGEVLLAYARRILQLGEEALSAASGRSAPATIRIGCIDEWASWRLPAFLRDGLAIGLPVRFEVTTGATADLMRGLGAHFDIVIGLRAEPSNDQDTLARSSVIWTGSPDAAASPGAVGGRGDPVRLALHPEGCLYRRRALDALDSAGIAWTIVYESAGCGAIEAAVRAGLAVTPVLGILMPDGLADVGRDGFLPPLGDLTVFVRSSTLAPRAARDFAVALRPVPDDRGPGPSPSTAPGRRD